MASSTWALTQISRLLPLDEDSLKQVIDYSSTLSKNAAAEHLKNLLGDSPQALEFITSFNSRREDPEPSPSASDPQSSNEGQPRNKQRKSKPPLKKLPPPRRPDDYGNTHGAYQKRQEQDYMPSSQKPAKDNAFNLSSTPAARQLPIPTSAPNSRNPSPKPPPSAAGPLLSDLPNIRQTSRLNSHPNSRTGSPAPKTKIALSGGTPMHGASSTLSDLDSAIRTLEAQTNPTLSSSNSADRACDCQATRHALLAAAPNCLNCGKIICVKEGLGPCTFCNTPLLSPSDVQAMIHALREERGKEKQDLNNAAQRRPEVAKTPRPFQNPPLSSSASGTNTPPLGSSGPEDNTLALAKQHRDKLLAYQAQNARRTRVIDEAADFETPSSGLSMWSSPVERAAQLKKQQRVLREQEWNAKPEYEKRRVVVSVDLVGGKVVRRMGAVEREQVADEEEIEEVVVEGGGGKSDRVEGTGTGAFGRNPLLGGMIRPVWKEGKGEGRDDAEKENRPARSTWRRVQDDEDDNEAWILDGGVYGGRGEERYLGDEEHAQG